MKTNFYLKSTPDSNNECLILLWFSFEGVRGTYSTGQRISEDDWNKDYQRARKSYRKEEDAKMDNVFTSAESLNEYLKQLANKAETIHRDAKTKGINPTIQYIKSGLDKWLTKGEEKKKTLLNYYDEFLVNYDYSGNQDDSTYKKYKTMKNHLISFSKDCKYEICFENMNEEFYNKIRSWFAKNDTDDTTASKHLANFKIFLSWALRKKYNKNVEFIKDFKSFAKQKEVISLTQDELFDLYAYKPKQKYLEQIKDVFCFSCFTALRWSDVDNIKPQFIKDEKLFLTTIKTDSILVLAVNDFAQEILDKYNNELPVISNQKSNKYLHLLLKQFGGSFNENVIKVRYVGNKRQDITTVYDKELKCERPLKRYDIITFHKGRTTNITLSAERGAKAETIMKNATILNWATMKRYLTVHDKSRHEEMLSVWKKPKPQLRKLG